MTKKSIIMILATAMLIVALGWVLLFIRYSNDHLECDTITETTVGKSGEKITITKHVCKEQFNF